MCNDYDCEWNEFGGCWLEMFPQLECPLQDEEGER